MSDLKTDEFFMNLAIKEALKGLGFTSPNPIVGAILVDPLTKEVISKGYHRGYGLPHAEIEAIEKAGEKAKGAVLYVTLEPCNHFGKTPPCTKRILEVGIKKVVCGIRDPNPVAGGGLEFLASNNIEVKVGVLEDKVKEITRFFLSRVLRKRPWVIAKIASSLDGKIAVSTGDSKWITDLKARKFAHKLRKICDAILVGKNTIIKDDPELTCRLVKGRNPIRMVLDTNLSLDPNNYKVFEVGPDKKTIIICGEKASKEKELEFKKKGVEVWRLPLKENKIDLNALMKKCFAFGINSILVEGGGKTHGTLVEEKLVDEFFYVIGPVIIGDRYGVPAIESKPIKSLKEALYLQNLKVRKIGNCFLFHGYTETGISLLKTSLGKL